MGIGMTLGTGWGSIALGGGIPAAETAFVFTVQTDNVGTSAANQFTIPTTGTGYNYDISTSDGQSINGNTGNTTITFPSAGSYDVKIKGDFPRIYFNNGGDKLKLTDIKNWGSIAWATFNSAFRGCGNLNITATDIPNVSAVTDYYFAFHTCSSLSGTFDCSSWDLSSVSNIGYMFYGCSQLTGINLSSLNPSVSVYSDGTAALCSNLIDITFPVSFKPSQIRYLVQNTPNLSTITNVESWDTSTMIASTFAFSSSSFNQNIDSWNVSSVTDTQFMFQNNTVFNQPIGSWNTSSVNYMAGMFYRASSFNQPISNWNVGNVTNMAQMFIGANAFNQDISTWNTSNVTTMREMFLTYMANPGNTTLDSIGSWDVSNVTDMYRMFEGVNWGNPNVTNWNTQSVTNFWKFMQSSGSFDRDLSGWNTSSATNMSAMFGYGNSQPGNIASWDIDQVTNFTNFMTSNNSALSTQDYDAVLVGWEAQVPQNNISITFGASTYTLGSAAEVARTSLINTYGWTITDGGGIDNRFTITVDTTLGNALPQFTIPTTGTGYNYDVETSDGQIITGNTGNTTITFPSTGTYDIKISGDFPRIYFNNGGDRLKLTDVKKWGSIVWSQLSYAFKGCANMTMSATDAPNLTQLQSLGGAQVFYDCSSFNSSIDHWDVSTINYMWAMFRGCTSFNQDLNSWDVSNVVDFQQMFENCTAFNGNITSWNIGNGGFRYMFRNAVAFNQDISGWDVSGISTMESMFNNADAFNQDLSSWTLRPAGVNMSGMFDNTANFNNGGQPLTWDTSSVTNMNYMFQNAISFNQPINTWNTSSVTFMSAMFSGATNFNQPLNNWNVSNVTEMPSMFQGASSFNQDISGWNVSSCQSMISMFRNASAFNYSIDSWDTSSVTNMSRMFQGAASFNQPLDNLNISNVIATGLDWILEAASSFNSTVRMLSTRPANVTRYAYIFRNLASFNQDVSYVDFNGITQFVDEFYACPSFNQSLAAWDITGITSGRIFGSQLNLSTANYGATLVSWEAQAPGWAASMNFGNSKYALGSAAEAARTSLINTYGWTITDGGGVVDTSSYIFTAYNSNPGATALQVTLQANTVDYTYDYNVETSDGQVFSNQTGSLTINFSTAGPYDIKVSGTYPSLRSTPWVADVKQFGTNQWQDFAEMYSYNHQITSFSATDTPDLSNCTSLYKCFTQSPNYNDPKLNNWDVSNIEVIEQMFFPSSSFNQPLDSWDTSSLTNMYYAFNGSPFNKSLAAWDVSSLTNAFRFLGAALSVSDYDATLISWAAQSVQNNVSVGFANSQYTLGGAAEAARNTLTNTYGWTITDGGGI